MRGAAVLLLLVAACDPAPPTPPDAGAGTGLERAAIAAGVIADPARIDPVGMFGIAGDHVCVVPQRGGYRIGARVDYGTGQDCAASGTATGRAPLKVDFGAGCTFDARFEGDAIAFPARVPAACDRLCRGRASLAALDAPRLSAAAAEAATLRSVDGMPLCTG